MPTFKKLVLPLFLPLVLLPLACASVSAQASHDPLEHLMEMDLQLLMDIKVTARKDEEGIYQVPLSFSVVDANTLRNLSVRKLLDLDLNLPGTFFNTSNNFSMRGIYTGTSGSGVEPGNSLFINGVYSLNQLEDQVLMDVERIEVLRGPQSTFYGRNTIAGAINIVHKVPELHTSSSEITVDVGTQHRHDMMSMINAPTGSNSALRISLASLKNDGHITNLYDGNDLKNTDLDSLRAQWRFDQGNIEVLWANDFTQSTSDTFPSQLRTPTTAEGQARLDALRSALDLTEAETPTSSLTVNLDTPSRQYIEHWGTILSVDAELSEHSHFSSTTARRSKVRDAQHDDDDMLPVTLINGAGDRRWTMTSQEFRLRHTLSDAIDVHTGLYLEQQNVATYRFINSGATLMQLLGINQPESAHLDYDTQLESFTRALYFNMDYALSEKWTSSIGARWHYESKDLSFQQAGTCFTEQGDLQGLCFFPQIAHRDKVSSDDFLPSASLHYALSDNALLFTRLSRGFKAAGFNANLFRAGVSSTSDDANAFLPDVVSDVDLRLDEEQITSFEVGYRGLLAADTLMLHGAAFIMNYEDFQTSRFTGTEYVPVNDGEALVAGLELEADYSISKALRIHVGAHHHDTKYLSYPTDQHAMQAQVNYKGNDLIYAPKFSTFARGNYTRSLTSELLWHTHLEWTYRDNYYTSPSNSPASAVSSSQRVNLKTGLLRRNDAWSLYLWARNLTDEVEETRSGIDATIGLEETRMSPPRSAGIELRVALKHL